ncbi:probable C-mannosyltransferase DPY19L3 isoform X1 [Octopus sinensis]|uniref:Probable C-mannosyltransferase DPY19L3 isoform X1 n=1 Tax=Octopus sinensis TaxID=2607531 RepID=A0A7E6FU23_9MOLL|nr:probable C-mannosyltransferase DPY19L3 isoform X1 [Octopus sinensis]XP_036370348.1 probable C-mannosyltransferase DPY19L3 isoform X1 [Octopus sinensis]
MSEISVMESRQRRHTKPSANNNQKNIPAEDKKAKRGSKKKKVPAASPPNSRPSTGQCVTILWGLIGILAAVAIGYAHARYMSTLHDNYLWFSQISELEREISFRTESGLYYSYYKQMVNAPSIMEGINSLTNDTLTEFPSSINVIERMNIYQEIILATIYRSFTVIHKNFQPVFFYIHTIFSLHGALVSSLFITAWMLSESWLTGVLAASFYIFNRLDTTRVEYVIPLRESFSLPFLWFQVAAISYYLRWKTNPVLNKISIAVVAFSTFLFMLFWQFSQFIVLLQTFSLFAVWVLGMVPQHKVKVLLVIELCNLLLVSVMQFCSPMIIGSLAVSFILSFMILLMFKNYLFSAGGSFYQFFKVSVFSLASLVLMVAINKLIKVAISLDADEHIFKFLLTKFGLGSYTDFDSQLYLCNGAFGFLEWDTFVRLTNGFVFPVYAVGHGSLLVLMLVSCFKKWRHKSLTSNYRPLLFARPEIAFHTVQALLFGLLAVSTLRMKYLWTPYMCILGSVFLADRKAWKAVLSKVTDQEYIVFLFRHFVIGSILASLLYTVLPSVYKELEDLKEFWDPDTVDLMEWIKTNSAPAAAFSGSMQLMAGVKLCTGRAITNHPHYEHKLLRQKTKMIYQIYGRKPPEEIYKILTHYKTTHIILEDSICLAPSRNGCRTPDLIDVVNGELPDDVSHRNGLVRNKHPRFCDEIRKGAKRYTKYFRLVFENRTFRVYQLL